jgi:hypothetical protein
MICYLLCSPALYHVIQFDSYNEAAAHRLFLRRPDWRIFKSELIEPKQNEKDVHRSPGRSSGLYGADSCCP